MDLSIKNEIYQIGQNLGLTPMDINYFINNDDNDTNKKNSSVDIYKSGTKYGTVSSSEFYKSGTWYGTVSPVDVYKASGMYASVSPRDFI